MALLTNATNSITQLTASGTSTWIDLNRINPKNASIILTWVNASSAIAKIEYSDDRSTVASVSENTTSLTNAGTVALTYPISVVYPYIRVNWVSGTATSLDASVESTISS